MVSNTLERVIRMMVAMIPVPSVTAGRIRLLSIGPVPSPIPCDGSQRSFSANRITSSRPSQKFGIDTEISPPTDATLSNRVYCFFADNIPSGMPKSNAMSILLKARRIVLGKRERIWSETLSFVL